MSINRKFTGVFIPAKIWISEDLTPTEKMLLAEIRALSEDYGWCYANNQHFASWLKCSTQNVSNYIMSFLKRDFVEVKYDNMNTFQGRKIRVNQAWYNALTGDDSKNKRGTPPYTGDVGGYTGAVAPYTGDVTQIHSKYTPKEKAPLARNGIYSPEFENAWTQYNHRAGSKKKAYSLFTHLKKPEQLKALAAIPLHVAATTTSKSNDGKNFKPLRCHFTTYLSEARWETYAERLESAAHPADSAPTEYDAAYQQYLTWTKENTPAVLDMVAQFSKTEFIKYKTEDFRGTSKIGQGIQLKILMRAHRDFNNELPAARQHEKTWPYFLELIEQELKSYAV